MKFFGIRRVFSTENEEQYETIGAFWDEIYQLKLATVFQENTGVRGMPNLR